jgi:hypothetical protein
VPDVILHLTDGQTATAKDVPQPMIETFVAWMDITLEDPGPITLDGVIYQRSDVEAFSIAGDT